MVKLHTDGMFLHLTQPYKHNNHRRIELSQFNILKFAMKCTGLVSDVDEHHTEQQGLAGFHSVTVSKFQTSHDIHSFSGSFFVTQQRLNLQVNSDC